MRILGVDPGKKGAFVIVQDQRILTALPMPTVIDGKFIDASAIAKFLKREDPYHAYIERVHAVFGASAGSTFAFGEGYGVIVGVISTLGIPFTTVPPKQWQKVMHDGVEEKYEPKHRSAVAAMRLFPAFDFTQGKKNYHDGLVDAALIAAYGERTLSANKAAVECLEHSGSQKCTDSDPHSKH